MKMNVHMLKRILYLFAFISVLLCENTVYAQEANKATLSVSNVKERINFIQASFDRSQFRSKIWAYSWMSIYAGLASYQTYDAVKTRELRTYNIVGASESILALLMIVAYPFNAVSSGDDLRIFPEKTIKEQEDKLDIAETWLDRNSREQMFGISCFNHLLNVGVALAGGSIVLARDGCKYGLISGVSSIIVSEIQIWTQPTDAIAANRSYKREYKDDNTNYNKIIHWFICASPCRFMGWYISM